MLLRVRRWHTGRWHTATSSHHIFVLVADQRHQLFHLRWIHVHNLLLRHVHEPFFRGRFLFRVLSVSFLSRFRGRWRRTHR